MRSARVLASSSCVCRAFRRQLPTADARPLGRVDESRSIGKSSEIAFGVRLSWLPHAAISEILLGKYDSPKLRAATRAFPRFASQRIYTVTFRNALGLGASSNFAGADRPSPLRRLNAVWHGCKAADGHRSHVCTCSEAGSFLQPWRKRCNLKR